MNPTSPRPINPRQVALLRGAARVADRYSIRAQAVLDAYDAGELLTVTEVRDPFLLVVHGPRRDWAIDVFVPGERIEVPVLRDLLVRTLALRAPSVPRTIRLALDLLDAGFSVPARTIPDDPSIYRVEIQGRTCALWYPPTPAPPPMP